MKKQSKRKTVGIDMDGVMANIEPQLLAFYEKEYGIQLTMESIQGLSYSEAFPADVEKRTILYTPGFFRTAPVMPGAVEAVKQLMLHYEVYIVSAATEFPLSLFEKIEWLQEHFPFIHWRNIVLCGDKSVVHTDYLIDDHCKNLDVCSGKAIMFNAHHNQREQAHLRVNNWEEVLNFFALEIQSLQVEQLN